MGRPRIRHLEAAYQEMWRLHCDGEPLCGFGANVPEEEPHHRPLFDVRQRGCLTKPMS